MLNRKTIMFLALLGTYAVQAGEFEEVSAERGYTMPAQQGVVSTSKRGIVRGLETASATPSQSYVYEPGKATEGTIKTTGKEGRYTTSEAPKPTKATLTTQLTKAEKDGGSELLCATAARFGRLLKYLPKTKGAMSKRALDEKCARYFLGDNDAGKIHPQAYAAIKGLTGDEKTLIQYARAASNAKGIIKSPGSRGQQSRESEELFMLD